MSVREVIFEEISNVANQQKKALEPVDEGSPLLGIGLDSLCFAILVARLEDRFEVDPFESSDDGYMPVTVGDFVAMYERVVA